MFKQTPILFQPGLYANRSARASQQRWVDGLNVRFRDAMPEQIGGWVTVPTHGDAVLGVAREIIGWRPNSGIGRYAGIGTEQGFYLFAGSDIDDITPAGFVAGGVDTVVGVGYGTGPYGMGSYGTPRTPTIATLLDAGMWSTDMFGETLIACFNADGKIYSFTAGTDTDLQEVTGVTARAIVVSDERHLFALGMNDDPTFVGWSDREDFTNFTASATNRAGGFTMGATSAFQCGRRVRGFVLAWTKTEVFGFYPLNNSAVYGRDRLGTGCGAAGPQAVAVVTDDRSEIALWLGANAFFAFDGAVREIECELRDYVFSDFNAEQAAKVQARTNAQFSEIWFSYCSADSDEIDRCVIYNYAKRTWSKSNVARTCWLDRGVFQYPIALAADGTIYEHETGDTADGEVIESYVVSHPITVGVGQQFALLNEFWPDMQAGSAACEVSFIMRDYPGAPDVVDGPHAFTETDEKIDLAISCRQFQVKIAGTAGYWELGMPLLSMKGGSLR